MSCNGCRILRKGCNDNCILRQSLQGIQSPQSQSNATVFVAKFFGRAGLMSFLSSVPQSQRPALFQSLLFEACGRTINPVNGAVGLLGTGNWHLCQTAVETVLGGGVLRPLPEFTAGLTTHSEEEEERQDELVVEEEESKDVDLGMGTPRMTGGGRGRVNNNNNRRILMEKRKSISPPSEESETTTLESCYDLEERETKILRLFF